MRNLPVSTWIRRGRKTQTISGQWVRRNLTRPMREKMRMGGVRNQKRMSATVAKLAKRTGLGKCRYWPVRDEVFCQIGWRSMGRVTRRARKIESRK